MHHPRQQNLYISFQFFRQLLSVVPKIHENVAHENIKMASNKPTDSGSEADMLFIFKLLNFFYKYT